MTGFSARATLASTCPPPTVTRVLSGRGGRPVLRADAVALMHTRRG